MKGFEFEGGAPAEFVERARGVLAEHGLTDFVTLTHDNGELVVIFSWMGSSELRYRLSENEAGFRAELSGERMSPFHAPFKSRFDDRFESVIEAVGAKIV